MKAYKWGKNLFFLLGWGGIFQNVVASPLATEEPRPFTSPPRSLQVELDLEGLTPQTHLLHHYRSFDGCNWQELKCVEYVYQKPEGPIILHHYQGWLASEGSINSFVRFAPPAPSPPPSQVQPNPPRGRERGLPQGR